MVDHSRIIVDVVSIEINYHEARIIDSNLVL